MLDRHSDDSSTSSMNLCENYEEIARIIEEKIKKTQIQIKSPIPTHTESLFPGASESLLSYALRLAEFKMAGDSWASIERTLWKDKEVLLGDNVVPESVAKLKEILLKLGDDPIEFITCEEGILWVLL